MKRILEKYYMMKWRNTDTYKRLKQKYTLDRVFIDENLIKRFDKESEILPIYISKNLFINSDLVEILNALHLRSISGGSYSIINEYNKALPIKWDEKNKKYFVKKGYENHPVTGISWSGAVFVAELFEARLPKEREWEIVATAGNSDYKYSWGNDEPNESLANYEENVGDTSEIGIYPSNDLGIYDMCGNVEEWCLDSMRLNDGGILKYEKVVKGGCWYKSSDDMVCSTKRGKWYKVGARGIGFRLVYDV